MSLCWSLTRCFSFFFSFDDLSLEPSKDSMSALDKALDSSSNNRSYVEITDDPFSPPKSKSPIVSLLVCYRENTKDIFIPNRLTTLSSRIQLPKISILTCCFWSLPLIKISNINYFSLLIDPNFITLSHISAIIVYLTLI